MTGPERPLADRLRDLDLTSLVAGLLALGVAVLFLLGETADREMHAGAVASYALGVLAVAGLLAGLRRAVAPADRGPREG